VGWNFAYSFHCVPLTPKINNMEEIIPPEYYLNGPDEFVNPNEEDDRRGWPEEEGVQKNNPPTKWAHEMNPNESTSSQEEIKKEAIEYCVGSPHYLFEYRAYMAGALSREKELVACRQSIAELIPIAEQQLSYKQYVGDICHAEESAIERAKALIK
jgi:hypothetical protein